MILDIPFYAVITALRYILFKNYLLKNKDTVNIHQFKQIIARNERLELMNMLQSVTQTMQELQDKQGNLELNDT